MRVAGWISLVLLAAAWSGCATGDRINPNLLVPKLVLNPQADGSVTLFVHSAFREHAYDRLVLRVDNATLVDREMAFSLEERVPSQRFFLEVAAHTGGERFVLRALVDLPQEGDHVSIAYLNAAGDWEDLRTYYGLPFERLLERTQEGSP